jgi:dTDP-glucose pyrophosphorylase
MNEKDKIKNITISPDSLILEALKLMDRLEKKLLLVMEGKIFTGLISIGDIQRAIINNTSLDKPVKEILRENIRVARENSSFSEIREMMLQHRTECMPVLNKSNELVTVHFWEDVFGDIALGRKKEIRVPLVIMAGGKGRRLKPFSNIIPKALFPYGEKTILEEIILRFAQHSISRVIISVNYKADLIRSYLEENLDLDLPVEYIQEEKPLGTAGSMYLLKDRVDSPFFVSNCDIIINQDYREIYDYHLDNGNDITIVAALKHYAVPYGIMETGEDGLLQALIEKPEYTYKINSGMYILNPEVLSDIPENTFFHITQLIEKRMEKGGKIGVFPVSEKSWMDIGEWSEYQKILKGYNLQL